MKSANSGRRRKYRLRAFKREQGKCFYCGIDVPIEKSTLDHIIPVVKGGRTKFTNLVYCCEPCNYEKNDQDAEGFLKQKILGKVLKLKKPSSI